MCAYDRRSRYSIIYKSPRSVSWAWNGYKQPYTLSLFRRGTVFSDKLAIDTPVVVPRQLDYELVQIRLTQRPRLGKLKLLKLVLNLVERVSIVRESRSDGALSIL